MTPTLIEARIDEALAAIQRDYPLLRFERERISFIPAVCSDENRAAFLLSSAI